MRRLLLLAFALVAAACTGNPPAPSDVAPRDRLAYVTSNDWHTRIVLPAAGLPPGLLPEAADFPGASWLAFGWGDHEYYPMPDPPRRLAIKAALLPSPAVLHIVPMPAPPAAAPGFEVVALALTAVEHDQLARGIDATVRREGAGRAVATAPGLYPESRFYPATGSFHLFNTCNRWLAQRLRQAGLPVRSTGVITAEDVMRQVRDLPMALATDG